jgi:hypothetical protein
MKYRTLKEFSEACTLARAKGQEPPVLTVDNDDTFAYQDGECVFRMGSQTLLEQALDRLGIPHEEV